MGLGDLVLWVLRLCCLLCAGLMVGSSSVAVGVGRVRLRGLLGGGAGESREVGL